MRCMVHLFCCCLSIYINRGYIRKGAGCNPGMFLVSAPLTDDHAKVENGSIILSW